MKSHVWSLWGRKFVVDGRVSARGSGILVGDIEYSVHTEDDGRWVPVRRDAAVGVLLSFLRRFDPKGREKLLDEQVPALVREAMPRMTSQFGRSRDAEADAYAICVLCSQRAGLMEAGTLSGA